MHSPGNAEGGFGGPEGGGNGRRPQRGRRQTVAIGLVLAVLGSGMAMVARAATRPEDPTRPAEGGALRGDEVDLPLSGMVVALNRPGLMDLPAQAGREAPVYVTVDAAEPVAAMELWVGPELVERVVPEADRTGRTELLTFFPKAPGTVTLVARAVDTEGRWGQSNPLRLEVIDPVPQAGVLPVVTIEGDTFVSVAERTGADPGLLASLNVELGLDPEAVLAPGTELGVPISLDDVPGPPPTEEPPTEDAVPGVEESAAEEDPEVEGQLLGPAAPARLITPLPAPLGDRAPPGLTATYEDCRVILTTLAESSSDLVLVQVPPSGGSFYPMVDLGGLDAGDTAAHEVPITAGLHTYAVVSANEGVAAEWSPLVEVVGPDECDGWSGTVRLTDGHLVTTAGEVPDVEAAYLYLTTGLEEWIRVPAAGFVTPGPDGFDFSPHLPPLRGTDLALEAWGRQGGELVELGQGSLRLHESSSLDAVLPSPKVQLHWIENYGKKTSKGHPQPEKLVTEGIAKSPEALWFRWSTAIPGITHAVWQVTSAPVSPTAGPNGGQVLLQGTVAAKDATFSVPLGNLLGPPEIGAGPAHLGAKGFGASTASLDGAGTYEMFHASAGLAPVTSMTASPAPLPGLDLLTVDGRYVVRLVPFAGDTYVGAVSNDVEIQTSDEPSWPEAPPDTPDHELDIELIDEPRPPNPVKTACWQISGYVDEEEFNAKLAAAQLANASNPSPLAWASNQYTFWHWIWDQMGDNPICAGCYHFGSTKVGLAGAKCADSSFLGDLFAAFKTLVDMVADGFAQLKSFVVEAVATLSGCKAVASVAGGGEGGESFCNTLAEVAVNTVLISLGIPPTLPNFDQLVAAAKADIVELGAALAAQAGVPCDDAAFAAEVHGEKGLTCAGAIEALLDQVATQISGAYTKTATAMGFNFPSELKVVPHPDGQVKPATVRIDVAPTGYSAAVEGKACTAAVLTGSTWMAPTNPVANFMFGTPPPFEAWVTDLYPGWASGPTYHKVPKSFWSNGTFEAAYLQLPDLQPPNTAGSGAYKASSQTYQLYPPLSLSPVDVMQASKGHQGSVSTGWTTIPRQVLLLGDRAKLRITAVSGCAGSATRHYELHGFTEPGAEPVEIPG